VTVAFKRKDRNTNRDDVWARLSQVELALNGVVTNDVENDHPLGVSHGKEPGPPAGASWKTSDPSEPPGSPPSRHGLAQAPWTDRSNGERPTTPYEGRIGEFLVNSHRITEQQLEKALATQMEKGGRLGSVLVDLGVLSNQALYDALAVFFDVSILNLQRENIEPSAIAIIPEEVARQHLVIPVRIEGDSLLVAAARPNQDLRDLLTQISGMPTKLMIAPTKDIRWAIDSKYLATSGVDQLVRVFEGVEEARRRTVDVSASEPASSYDAPIVQVVDRILTQAMRSRASDVHIEPSDELVHIRFRIDGALQDILQLPASIGPGLVSRIKIMANMNIVERRRPQDGQLTVTIDGKDLDVRVATVATIMGEKCVLRILNKTLSVLRLDDLGMPTDTHNAYSKLIRAPFGMVLCAGPTGSGKTTTLYATISEINNPELNIMTIEDPVEYIFPDINQIQTNDQAGLTFATGLKSILRQDPDVILVGEIRDVETTRVAVQSALTGHFVVSSMHATNAVSALHRLLDMGIESFLVSSAVLAVVGQRLLRRTCLSCKTEYTPSEEELLFYKESGGPEKNVFYHGVGCNFCSHTGYKDRIGVYELLIMTPELKRLIVGWATQEELHNLAVKQGMHTLRQEAIHLVSRDITSIAEVIRSVYTL